MRWNGLVAATAVGLLLVPGAFAQAKKKVAVNPGENALVGIRLYDTGLRVLSLFGNPDEIQPINVGGGAVGPTGGGAPSGFGGAGAAPGAGPGFGGGPAAGGGRRPPLGAGSGSAEWNNDFQFGDEMLNLQGPPAGFRPPGPPGGYGGGGIPGQGGMPAGGPQGPPGGIPGYSGPAGAPRGGAGGAGAPRFGGGAPSGGTGVPTTGNAAGASGTTAFTRWVYNRNGSKYGFVLDNHNRVIQVEAMGLANGRVRTKKGLTFGATFAEVLRKYGAPEQYEINGDIIVMRYLVKNKIAFRLSRLAAKKPHQVTAVVVAAGKA